METKKWDQKEYSGTSALAVLLMVGGLTWGMYSLLFFDTSVVVPQQEIMGQTIGGERINNIGLMQEKQNGINLGFGAAVVGLAIMLFDKRNKKEGTQRQPHKTMSREPLIDTHHDKNIDTHHDKNKEPIKITLGLVLGWGLGVLAAISGVTLLFSEPFTGFLILLLAAVLLPPVNKFITEKLNFSISVGMKIIVVIIILGVIGATVSTDSTSNITSSNNKVSTQPVVKNTQVVTENKNLSPVVEKTNTQPTPAKTKTTPATTQASTPTPAKAEYKPTPISSETVSQKNAVRSAKSYLDYSAFSHDGLVAQLEYGQFSHADAVYGADNSGANWNEQAAKSAKSYMEYSAFSRGSLIEQLKYGKFTQVQAEYGANAVGL